MVAPKLLFYYGIPQGVNALWDSAAAAQLFAAWDVVVFGVGLQDPAHMYHESTADVIDLMRGHRPRIQVFGYIDLSVECSNLPIETIRGQIREWKATGADSIFFDLAGYSFGTTRARQNAVVDHAHELGMPVMLNTDVPDDVLGSTVDETYNPTGAAPRVGPRDFYLLESWIVSTSAFASSQGFRWLVDAKQRADAAVAYRDLLGVKLAAVNSVDYSVTPDEDLRTYFGIAEAMAMAWNLDAYGFAPTGYSGLTPNVNVLRPLPYDARYTGYVERRLPYSVNSAVTEIRRPDIPLTVHLDVNKQEFWYQSPE